MLRRLRRGCLAILTALLVGACVPAPTTGVVLTATPSATPVPKASNLPSPTTILELTRLSTSTPFPTTDFQSDTGLVPPTLELTSLPIGSPVTTPDVLRFDFGTQTPFPTLNWRPPPMPVPVSIRPEDHFWLPRPIASNSVNWPHPLYRYGSTNFWNVNSHTGVDIDAPYGTPVLAAGAGVVVWVGYGLYGTQPPEDDPYGLAVAVKHNFGYQGQTLYTVYAHLSAANVWLDQPVQAGEQLGEVGSTGFSSGPHVHLEVRLAENKFRNTYNPELWLAPPTGWGVLAGRVLDGQGNYLAEVPIEVYDADGRYYPIWTYGSRSVNPDPIYRENFVLSDLPAGRYWYWMLIKGERYEGVAEIYAGQTTFVVVQEGIKDIPITAEPRVTNGTAPETPPP